ncbi:MAG TPA: hypothetical protein VFQ61_18225, partial [Polyangiaceae bacterium]|nr:hypothetical protein [Polyangiaceae bacterium]
GQVVGHVAVATHVRALALEFLRLHWGAALRCAGRRLLSAGTLSRAFATLSYTLRPKLPRLPQAEILTLSVSERHARLGLLGLIYESLVAQVQSRGVTALRIVTAVRLGRLHGFLERRGWQHRYTMTLHPGEASRVYVLESLGAS